MKSTKTSERQNNMGIKQALEASHLRRFLLPLLIGFLSACLVFQFNDTRVLLQAARDVLSLHAPYNPANYQFVSPVAVTLIYAPFALLPSALALRLLAFLSVSLYAYIILRTARRWWIGLLLMLTPIFLYNVFAVNVDWIVFAALLMPPPLAFVLSMLKPQIGAGVALLALLMMWNKNKPLALALVALEACIYAVSYALGMRWSYVYTVGNFSLFPFSLIIGLPLLVLSIRRRDSVMALAAMPLCAPYVGPQSWIAVLPLLARYSPIRKRGGLIVASAYPPVNGVGNAP